MAHAWLTVPNAISFLRLALVPVFVWLRLIGEPGMAFLVFIVAAATDALDGFLARVLNQRSKVGGIIDPAADKLLVFSALATLVVDGLLPLWLLVLEGARDTAMAIGALLVKRRQLEIPTTPSRIGKYSTLALVATVTVALASASPRAPQALAEYVPAIGFIAALCVVVSTLQYWTRFGYLIIAPERARKAPSVKEQRRTPA
ncbi:MAG TPA: CDP-alcohol phosphatidyltransferase family protein [Myxococcaceae bacterium]|nr:CDP-alcohol phosphatidyltransferase family protein [Myxococcaceae bacterium]